MATKYYATIVCSNCNYILEGYLVSVKDVYYVTKSAKLK